MVKPRSLDVERSLRGSPRIENLKEEGVLESIARKWDLDVLITIWLEVHHCSIMAMSAVRRLCSCEGLRSDM